MSTLRDVIAPTALKVNVRACRCRMTEPPLMIVMLAFTVTIQPRLLVNVKISYL